MTKLVDRAMHAKARALSPDQDLHQLALPTTPEELRAWVDVIRQRAGSAFATDLHAKQCRESWVGSRFVELYGRLLGFSVKVRKISDAPDLECVNGNTNARFGIEVAELLSTGPRRDDEYREPPTSPQTRQTPDKAMTAERRSFAARALDVIQSKALADCGRNCILVLYVNLRLFDAEPIQEFIRSEPAFDAGKFQEIWFYYDGGMFNLFCKDPSGYGPRSMVCGLNLST